MMFCCVFHTYLRYFGLYDSIDIRYIVYFNFIKACKFKVLYYFILRFK